MTSAPAKPNIDALTSFRFFAALVVLVFHSGASALTSTGLLPWPAVNFLRNGWWGVSFFFILSGFILTYVYHGKLQLPQSLPSYAMARVARVYPVYLLALLMAIPFIDGVRGFADVPQFILLHQWLPYGMIKENVFSNWNYPGWTLSTELLFYVSFPFLLKGLEKVSTRMLLVIVGILWTLMLSLGLPTLPGPDSLPFLDAIPLPVIRLPEFVYGVCLGLLYHRGVVPVSKRGIQALLVLVCLVACSTPSALACGIAAILFGGIIVLTPNSLQGTFLGKILQNPCLVLLGASSYALYICQTPFHHLIDHTLGALSPKLAKASYHLLLIAFSIGVYLYFEEPLRKLIRTPGKPVKKSN